MRLYSVVSKFCRLVAVKSNGQAIHIADSHPSPANLFLAHPVSCFSWDGWATLWAVFCLCDFCDTLLALYLPRNAKPTLLLTCKASLQAALVILPGITGTAAWDLTACLPFQAGGCTKQACDSDTCIYSAHLTQLGLVAQSVCRAIRPLSTLQTLA